MLPPALKLAVPLGAVVQLASTPAAPVDGYWKVKCAAGPSCGIANSSTTNTTTSTSTTTTTTTTTTDTDTPLTDVSGGQVLVVGDSISIGYFPYMQKGLEAAGLEAVHSPGNAGNANNIEHQLHCWALGANANANDGRSTVSKQWKVLTFNAGIHDLARGQEWLSLDVYVISFFFFSLLFEPTSHK